MTWDRVEGFFFILTYGSHPHRIWVPFTLTFVYFERAGPTGRAVATCSEPRRVDNRRMIFGEGLLESV